MKCVHYVAPLGQFPPRHFARENGGSATGRLLEVKTLSHGFNARIEFQFDRTSTTQRRWYLASELADDIREWVYECLDSVGVECGRAAR